MNTSPTQRPASLVLAGNALSVLIAATERAHRGLATTIINPGGPLGGYFSGVHALGRRVMAAWCCSSSARSPNRPWHRAWTAMIR